MKGTFLAIVFLLFYVESTIARPGVPFLFLPANSVPDFTWTGGGGNSNWNNPANWSSGVIPGASDVAKFDSSCNVNCNVTIDISVSVAGISIAPSFTGTITQGSGNTLTVGTSGYSQASGTFLGGNSSVVFNGTFSLSGGVFTNTSGSSNIYNNFSITGGTFNHNNGSINFNIGVNYSLITNGTTFNNINFTAAAEAATLTLMDNFTVSGNLSLSSVMMACWCGRRSYVFPSGTRNINLAGNLIANLAPSGPDFLHFGNTNLTITVNGNSNQSFSQAGQLFNANVVVNKSGGAIQLASNFNFGGRFSLPLGQTFDTSNDGGLSVYNPTFGGEFSRVGNFNVRTSTVTFSVSDNYSITTNGLAFFNLNFLGGTSSVTVTLMDDFSVNGSLQLSSIIAGCWCGRRFFVYPSGTRNINVAGNIVANTAPSAPDFLHFGNSSLTVTLNGSGDQSLTKNGQIFEANLVVNKSSGVIKLNTAFDGNFAMSVLAGTVNMSGYALTIQSLLLNSTVITKGGGTLTVNGSTVGTGPLFGGTVNP